MPHPHHQPWCVVLVVVCYLVGSAILSQWSITTWSCIVHWVPHWEYCVKLFVGVEGYLDVKDRSISYLTQCLSFFLVLLIVIYWYAVKLAGRKTARDREWERDRWRQRSKDGKKGWGVGGGGGGACFLKCYYKKYIIPRMHCGKILIMH